MNDAYRELVKCLRDGVTQPADGGEATRHGILSALPAAGRMPRGARTWLLLAAALCVSTAFALYIASPSGREREPAAGRRSASVAPPATLPDPSTRPPHADDAARTPAVPTAPTQSEASRDRAAPRAAKRAAPNAAARSASTSAKPAATNADAAASSSASPERRKLRYIEAHRQHFRGAPQQALAAWDAFLATDPSGPLLLEAQYNRALTLLRVGRRGEAEQALLPFARGDHAGFRQVEAKQLLQQLGH